MVSTTGTSIMVITVIMWAWALVSAITPIIIIRITGPIIIPMDTPTPILTTAPMGLISVMMGTVIRIQIRIDQR
jgi:hypothetical protein